MTATTYAEDTGFARFVRAFRHPLRAVALGCAVLGMVWGLVVTPGLVAAVVGTVLGVGLGEWLGRTKLRSASVLALGVLVLVVFVGGGALTVRMAGVTTAVGLGTALDLAAVLRYGGLALGVVGTVRALSVRRPSVLIFEVLLVVAGLAAVFAAHRDGVIARPLWLSDWAWQRDVDPGHLLLGIGAGGAVLLGILLAFEQRGALSFASLVAVPALALLVMVVVQYTGVPAPKPDDGIGLMDDSKKHPGEDPKSDDTKRRSQQGRGPSPGEAKDGPGTGTGQGQGGGTGTDGGVPAGRTDGGASPTGAKDGGGASPRNGDAGGASGSEAPDAGAAANEDQTKSELPPPPPPKDPLQNEGNSTSRSAPAPMAVVVFENDYSPPSKAYYFRQGAWSQWNGSRLVPTTTPDVDVDVPTAFPTKKVAIAPPPSAGRTTVSLRVAMLADHEAPFGLESPVSMAPIKNPDPDRFTRAYRVRSMAQTIDYADLVNSKAGNPSWSAPVRDMYLQPHPDARYQKLADDLVATLPEKVRNSPFARAAVIKVWLDKELTYSTKERHAGVDDPTTDFLFGNRVGYCVHFAHAAVFLFRAAGVPARVGTGYMVAEETRRGGSALLVRSADAHAWPEIYVQGAGWIVFDISPEKNLDEAGTPMDEDMQRMYGELAREEPPMDDSEARDAKPVPYGRYLSMGALVTVLMALLLGYATKAWRRVAPLFARDRALLRVGYRAVLDRLAEAGFVREYGETREAFAARVAAQVPSLGRLTALHVTGRLRDPARAPTAEELSEFGGLSRTIRGEIAAVSPWWRRMLGLLHPGSFLQVK